MTSRERVLATLAHEQPDRVPADIWAEPQVWARLKKDLGLKTEKEVKDHLEIDIDYLKPTYPEDIIENGVKSNMWGERWKNVETCFGKDWEHIDGVLSDATLKEVEAFKWPSADDVDYSDLKKQVKAFQGKAIFYGDADFFERPALVRGFENFLVDVMLNHDIVEYMQEKFTSFFIEDFYRAMEASERNIDVFLALTDLGTQEGPLLGDEVMEKFIYAPLAKLIDVVHREGVKFMFHSCGAIRKFIPKLIDLGVDILNPIQPRATGMEPAQLKRDFGEQIVFHGGIDIQYLLPMETKEVVSSEVGEITSSMFDGGGYILAPSHNLQPDISTENIVAMYNPELRNKR